MSRHYRFILAYLPLLITSYAIAQDSLNIRLIGHSALPAANVSYPLSVTWTNQYIVVGRSNSYGSEGYRVTNPTSPTLVWQEPSATYRETCSAIYDNGYLYEAGIFYARIAHVTPNNLIPIDSIPEQNYILSVAKHGDSLLFGSYLDGIHLVIDSAHTRLINRLQFATGVSTYSALCWQGNYLYAADADYGLRVFTPNFPAIPQQTGSLPLNDDAFDIKINNDHAYIATDQAGVLVVNVADPESPSVVARIDTGGHSRQLVVSGEHLFVADLDRGLRVYSLLDSDHPFEVGYYNTGLGIRCLAVHDSLVYACDSSRFLVFDCRSALPVRERDNTTLPTTLSMLSNYPNPFNTGTTFRFSLPGHPPASLTIYDVTGRLVWKKDIAPHEAANGVVSWSGVSSSGTTTPSGTYFSRVSSAHSSAVTKITVMR